MKDPKIFSFFSGSGFLDLGFETNGFDIEFVNEFSPSFLSAYKYSRAKMRLRQPTFGYWNTDINEYLDSRSEELDRYIAQAREDRSLIGFIGGPLVLILVLRVKTEVGTAITVNCPYPISI